MLLEELEMCWRDWRDKPDHLLFSFLRAAMWTLGKASRR